MNGFIVQNGGIQSSIQDAGRRGLNDIGLSQSGAMDELSFGYANLLVGNAFNTPAIEIALGGASFMAQNEMSIAICGADMSPTCNGKTLGLWQTHTLKKGDILSFGFAALGQFAYVAIAGGFQTPFAYGSFSTSLKEGLGGIEGRKLKAGDALLTLAPCCLKETYRLKKEFIPAFSSQVVLRVVKGYQEHLFDTAAQERFFSSTYTYKGEGDRMGYRLSGAQVIPSVTGILSEPICFGAIQIPLHGEPIVLLKERQTIGGYPKMGSVIMVDCFKLAQLQAGGTIRFEAIGLEAARAISQRFYTFFSF